MMPNNCKYALLLASLPRHPQRLFLARQTPISRIKLEQRLLLLDAADAMELKRIESLEYWSTFSEEADDRVIEKCRSVIGLITDDVIKQLAQWHLELRTLMSVLRLKNAGAGTPSRMRFQGFGVWPDYVERNWHGSGFGVGHRLPWLIEAQTLLAGNKSFELEKFLLELVWRQYADAVRGHYFDFPAVAIYVLRWNLTQRWVNYDSGRALECFDRLIEGGLKECEGI